MGAIKVESGKVVVLSYVLKDEGGEIIDETTAADPFPYLHGAENIVPGLEAALTGKLVGDKFEAVVSPREGFGERIGEPQIVPRSAFPEGMPIEVGMQFIASDGESEMPVWIVGQEGDELLVDNNHPLAGVTLHFAGTILAIRDALQEELSHGHPHGVDGLNTHDH